jgi:glutaminyl-peptide cyclotransferase
MSTTARLITGVVGLLAVVASAVWLWNGPPATATPAVTVSQSAGGTAPATNTGFDSARAWQHLQQIVGIGPRPAGSPGIRQTRAYIGRQISGMGLTMQEQTFTAATPVGPVEMSNLVVRIPGRRQDRILIAGHYDTKILKGQTFVGASDGGSSAAFLIEMARVLKASPQREFTYELVWFDGEEAFCVNWDDCGTPASPDHTYGSRYYVQAAQKAGAVKSIHALLLVDLIGDRDLQFRRESNSAAWLKDIIWGTARSLAYDRVFIDAEMPVEDDHIPFVRAGVPSVDIIDLDYPYWHTPDDNLDHVSARSLQIVGDVLLASLPKIEARPRTP